MKRLQLLSQVAFISLVLALLGGCDPSVDLNLELDLSPSSKGQLGGAELAVHSGIDCFFGCRLDRAFATGTTELAVIGVLGAGQGNIASVTTDDAVVMTAEVVSARTGELTLSLRAGASGDALLSVVDDDGSEIDRFEVHVRAPDGLFVARFSEEESLSSLELDLGERSLLQAVILDSDEQTLFGDGLVSFVAPSNEQIVLGSVSERPEARLAVMGDGIQVEGVGTGLVTLTATTSGGLEWPVTVTVGP